MKLKLKESIRANGVQHLPPAIIDTDEIGITQADADVLVRRGTADVYEEAKPTKTEDDNVQKPVVPTESGELSEKPEATAKEAVTEAPAKPSKKR